MSTDASTIPTPESLLNRDNPEARESVQWAIKHWPRLLLAHDALMLEKIQRQNRIVEVLARNSMTGDHKDLDGWPGKSEENEVDEMGVKVGDEIHYHAAPVSQPQPPAQPSQPTLEPESESTWKTWAKRLGIPLAAAGLGAGGLAGYDWLTGPEEKPPAVEQPAVEPYTAPTIIGPGVSTGVIPNWQPPPEE